MTAGRPKKREIVLSPTERKQLQSYARARALPHALVRRAKIVLWSANGDTNTAIAQRLQVSQPTVGLWRRRFLERGLAGLYAERPAGHAHGHNEERVARLMQQALSSQSEQGTHWSVRAFAKASGVSKSSVQRYFSSLGIQPHRRKSLKLSNDPFFVEKVRDIVGLYLHPPENALVLCVDEKSKVRALERSQPILPRGLGYVEGVTHDYFRHGTTTLFAALDIANGSVIAQCKRRHRHEEFLAFLWHVERNVPAKFDIHLVVDNYSTHKHAKVRAWLAKRPRFHLHFTPTYASWLNQVERWFGLITRQAIRRGSYKSVPSRVRHIQRYVERQNQHCCPFMWTASAESILAKVERISKLIGGTRH